MPAAYPTSGGTLKGYLPGIAPMVAQVACSHSPITLTRRCLLQADSVYSRPTRVSDSPRWFGKTAKIEVHRYAASGKVKYASLHDFRRSFGERWSDRVMPVVLKELMRHSQIETTLRYYVGQDATRTADILWKAHENARQTANDATEPKESIA
jgi:integrase